MANEMKIALLRYLNVVPRHGELPDPDGPPSAIDAANAAVSAAREGGCPQKLGPRTFGVYVIRGSHERNTLSRSQRFPFFYHTYPRPCVRSSDFVSGQN